MMKIKNLRNLVFILFIILVCINLIDTFYTYSISKVHLLTLNDKISTGYYKDLSLVLEILSDTTSSHSHFYAQKFYFEIAICLLLILYFFLGRKTSR